MSKKAQMSKQIWLFSLVVLLVKILNTWFFLVPSCSSSWWLRKREVWFTLVWSAWKVQIYSLRSCCYMCHSSTARAEQTFRSYFEILWRYLEWHKRLQMLSLEASFFGGRGVRTVFSAFTLWHNDLHLAGFFLSAVALGLHLLQIELVKTQITQGLSPKVVRW